MVLSRGKVKSARSVALVAAPVAIQPGGYIREAYRDRHTAVTGNVSLKIDRTTGSWRILLTWACREPVRDASRDTGDFVDSAALLVPRHPEAPMMTMGAEGHPVEGALWRADRKALVRIGAAGLGTVDRSPAPQDWKVNALWENGNWGIVFDIGNWTSLHEHRKLGIAIWQGKSEERGGLKSVTADWLDTGAYTA